MGLSEGQEAGPFVVTHRRRPEPGPRGQMFREWEVLSQRAVATLGEMRLAAESALACVIRGDAPPGSLVAVASTDHVLALADIRKLDEKGGRVSLPDGSEVEVRPATAKDIEDAAFMRIETKDEAELAAVIAAYNARFGSEAQAGGVTDG